MATYVLLKCHSLRNVGTPNKIQHQFLIKTSCPLHRKPSHKEKKSILGDEVSGPDDFLNCALSQNKTQLPLCVSVPTAMLFSTCCSNTPKFQRQKLKAENQKKVPNRRFAWLQLMILSSMGIEICRKMSVSTSLGGVSSSVKLILKATSGTPPQSSLSQKQLTVCPLRTPAIWGVGGEFGEPVQGSARVFLFHSNHFPSSCLDLHFTCNF